MCVAVWIWQSHPSYPLLLLLNRDEFHDRPTTAVGWWGDGGEKVILAGRDELGGGTWLGCTKGGRFAFLTNFREPGPRTIAKSRGELPVRFLKSKQSPLDCANEIAKEADSYNGFNLILADLCSKSMVYTSNRPRGECIIQIVSSGMHVLSNASLDTPWPKAVRLGKNFAEFVKNNGEIPLKQIVRELMEDSTKADRDKLPETGCDPEREYQLSSIFIDIDTDGKMGRYGTRSMAGILVKQDEEVSFYERYLEGDTWKAHLEQFHIG